MIVSAMPPNTWLPSCARTTPTSSAFVTEDSLSSNAPHIETLQAHGLHYLLGVKEGDHAFLFGKGLAGPHYWQRAYLSQRAKSRQRRFSISVQHVGVRCLRRWNNRSG